MDLKLAEVLKRELKQQRVSVKILSKETGVAVSTIHEWLGGRNPRSIVQAKKVANFLGLGLNNLLFDESEKTEEISIQKVLKDEVFSGVFEITIKRIKDKSSEKRVSNSDIYNKFSEAMKGAKFNYNLEDNIKDDPDFEKEIKYSEE